MDLRTLRIQGTLLFVTLRVSSNNNSKNLPSPPDESECQSCVVLRGRLLSFYQVWLKNACYPEGGSMLQNRGIRVQYLDNWLL